MSSFDLEKAPDEASSAFGAMTRRRSKRLPIDRTSVHRLAAKRLANVLGVLADASPTEASALLAGRVPLGPPVASTPPPEQVEPEAPSVDSPDDAAVEIPVEIPAEVVLDPAVPDTGRHRRIAALPPEDSAIELPTEAVAGPGIPAPGGRHRRVAISLPEDSARELPAEAAIAPETPAKAVTAPAVITPDDSAIELPTEAATPSAEVVPVVTAPEDSARALPTEEAVIPPELPAEAVIAPVGVAPAEVAPIGIAPEDSGNRLPTETVSATEESAEAVVIDTGRHRRPATMPNGEVPQPTGDFDAPHHGRGRWGKRTAPPATGDSETLTPSLAVHGVRPRTRQLAMLGLLLLLLAVAVILGIQGSGALSSAADPPVATAVQSGLS
jgi:hypothetical protein